jgi:hypothetical protein
MGNSNKIHENVPEILMKNWEPVHMYNNLFRNKITLEYCVLHCEPMPSTAHLQSLALRMQEKSTTICRVLFYHQYGESMYHIYTDCNIFPLKIHPKSTDKNFIKWKELKLQIVNAFQELKQIYGFFKIVTNMVQTDGNGQPKVWIHPNAV